MSTSQNGWPVLDKSETRVWVLPPGHGSLRLAAGPAGFVLAHWALWYAEHIEALKGPVLDDWGWAVRSIRGRSGMVSNHSSGTACDLNAQAHVLGRRKTLRTRQMLMVRSRLEQRYGGIIRWGGDYIHRPDEMHYEIDSPRPEVAALAVRLGGTLRGRRLRTANPGPTDG